MSRLGLTRDTVDYGLEYFSMLRQGSDVLAAYENAEQHRKMRQAYCAHILDHVIRERH